jgi:hypothetical protein
MQSDHKSQLITICMLIGALATIGLALTGSRLCLPPRSSGPRRFLAAAPICARSHSNGGVMVHDVGEAEM